MDGGPLKKKKKKKTPKTRNNLVGVELGGNWRTPRRFGHKRLTAPITTKENPNG